LDYLLVLMQINEFALSVRSYPPSHIRTHKMDQWELARTSVKPEFSVNATSLKVFINADEIILLAFDECVKFLSA
jgi:hypothetical protein